MNSFTTMTSRKLKVPATLIGGLILLAACSPSHDATAVPEPTPSSPARYATGPLDEIRLRISGWQPNATEDQQTELELINTRAREEFIAACMAEQGFQYIPFLETSRTVVMGDGTAPDRDSREFAEQSGFGYSVPPPPSGAWTIGPNQANDPNQELRAAMSDAELAAWDYALHGGSLMAEDLDVAEFAEWMAELAAEGWQGCWGMAWEAVHGTPDGFEVLSAEIDNFYRTITTGTHPNIAALNAEWAACMANQGFPALSSPRLLQELMQDEHHALAGATVFRDGEGIGLVWGGEVATPQQRLAFQEREFALALANYDCRAETSYQERHNQISFALQQEFVDQHRPELEAWELHAESIRAGQ